MDESTRFRLLSTEEFTRLTPEEKFAYLDAAIKVLLTRRDGVKPENQGESSRREE